MQLQQVSDISTEVIDHHGLIAAVSRDLGIAEKIMEVKTLGGKYSQAWR